MIYLKILLYLKTIYRIVKGGFGLAKDLSEVYEKIKAAKAATSAGGRAITKKESLAIMDEAHDVLERLADKHFKG